MQTKGEQRTSHRWVNNPMTILYSSLKLRKHRPFYVRNYCCLAKGSKHSYHCSLLLFKNKRKDGKQFLEHTFSQNYPSDTNILKVNSFTQLCFPSSNKARLMECALRMCASILFHLWFSAAPLDQL